MRCWPNAADTKLAQLGERRVQAAIEAALKAGPPPGLHGELRRRFVSHIRTLPCCGAPFSKSRVNSSSASLRATLNYRRGMFFLFVTYF
jgi:hypothetical protein